MKTLKNMGSVIPAKYQSLLLLSLLFVMLLVPQNAQAHCDSYDGPVIKAAIKALEANNVTWVLKWVEAKHEPEIKHLFAKTASLKKGDQEIYQIVEKHFLETLVRLHREGEGAPYTGLKPAGATKPIISMADQALAEKDIEGLLTKLNGHIEKVVKEKYQKAEALRNVKDESVEKGRAYVAAYVDYTHTLEALHAVLEHSDEGHGHAAEHKKEAGL